MYRLSDLETQKIGHRLWRVTRPLIFELSCGERVTVPINFITDGASCPKILWSLCSPMSGPQVEAAVLHDFLYSKDSSSLTKGILYSHDRKQADQIFYDTMISNRTSKWKAKLIYRGVRLCGSRSWKACHSIDKIKD